MNTKSQSILEDLEIEVAAAKILGFTKVEARRLAVEIIKDRHHVDFSHLLPLGEPGQSLPAESSYEIANPETLKDDIEELVNVYKEKERLIIEATEKRANSALTDLLVGSAPEEGDDLPIAEEEISLDARSVVEAPVEEPTEEVKPFLARDLDYDARPDFLASEELFITIPNLAKYFGITEPAMQEKLKHIGFQEWTQNMGWKVTPRGSMYVQCDSGDLLFNGGNVYKWNLQAINDADDFTTR